MKTPLLDKILIDNIDACESMAEINGVDIDDCPLCEAATGASKELEALKAALKASQERQEATSKALYDMQFVQHEDLLNRYCALRNTLKSLVEGFGYEIKVKVSS